MTCNHINADGSVCGIKSIHNNKCIRHINQSCVICQEVVTTRNTFSTRRLKCGHAYHTQCLMSWLSTEDAQATCPTCREDLSDMDLVIFKNKIEDNLREKYRATIDCYELDIRRLNSTIDFLRDARR